MARLTTFPKEKINILLLENIHTEAVALFKQSGYTNIKALPNALNEQDLIDTLSEVHILGIRSKTHLSSSVLQRAPRLLSVGCFCIGTNQVDLKQAAQSGIPVFNAPYSNTRSVAELVIGAAIMLIRKILPKNLAAHQEIWQKQATKAYELRGKTIGIVGYGNIGSQVSVLAEALGMQVLYYDIQKKLPLGNAKACTNLDELLQQADVLTLHIPELPGASPLLDEAKIARIKKGACVINYARGTVIDLPALRKAYDEGHIGGVALDVYPIEPEKNGDKFSCPFTGVANALLTPHIGGSTEEAQAGIGHDVAEKMLRFLETGNTHGSQSIPELALNVHSATHRILHIHRNVPGVLSAINSIISKQGLNITAQYLKTNEEVGYVVLDIADELDTDTAQSLKQIEGTIKVRLLY